MGSPITFSGFNNIDFNMILNAVMQQESQPLTALQNQQTALNAQNSAFGTLAGKLSALGTAADALKDANSLAKIAATSSDSSSVGVSSASGTISGTYAVAVTTLAAAQVSASQTYTSTDAIVGGAGQTLTLTPASGDPVTITLTGDTTLQQLANQINSRTEPPATASIVQISPGHYQLVLTAAATGTDNAFTIRSTMTGGEGLTFSDKDGDGVSGDDPEDTTRAAADASFTVNGLHVTSSSNTASDVIPGVTLSLNKASANAVVSVTRDSAGTKDLVKKFIDAYNAVVQFTKDQQTASNNGQTNIARDPLLRGFRDNLRSALLGEYSGGSYARLAEIGLGFDRDGKMVLDTATFDKAMASTPNEVQKLFSGDAGDGGAFGAISTLIDGYTGAGGLVAGIRNRLDDEAAGIGRRMDSMSAALEIRRQSLQREYIAADLAMTQLKSQSGSLANLGNGLSF